MRITLCLNCLEEGAVEDVAVGAQKGTQRDPYRDTLALCSTCASALKNGDFATLADRQADTRTIRRAEA